MPARVCARAGRAPLLEGQRDSPATLLALLLTALAGYGVWLLALPGSTTPSAVAERSGAVAVGTRMLTDWLIGLLIAFWAIFTAVDALPLLQNPGPAPHPGGPRGLAGHLVRAPASRSPPGAPRRPCKSAPVDTCRPS